MAPGKARPAGEYTIGWICALSIEQDAACAVLDTIHSYYNPPGHPAHDRNSYVFGNIGEHNIVIVTLPEGIYGNTKAADVAARMVSFFHSIKFLFLVGIGGGIPYLEKKVDIRLGDVVVSVPEGQYGGVVKWDMGKTVEGGEFNRTGALNRPPDQLLSIVGKLQTRHRMGHSTISQYISEAQRRYPNLSFAYLGQENDKLFSASYGHRDKESLTCSACNPAEVVRRSHRGNNNPVIHTGIIASGDQVIKDAPTRDKLRKELKAKCFEMEGAGIMDVSPCLVVRGICDYSDSHKNKDWQQYAALTAAAYTKEVLDMLPAHNVAGLHTSHEVHDARAQSNITNTTKTSIGRNLDLTSARYSDYPRLSPSPSQISLRGPKVGTSQLPATRPYSCPETTAPVAPPPLDPALKRYSSAAVAWSSWSYRVYFQDSRGIFEATRDTDAWSVNKLTDIDAATYTPLAVVARKGGNDIRLYYLTPDLIIQERRFTPRQGWFAGGLDHLKIKASPNSRIAAVGWSGHIRLYYQGYNYGRLEELRYADSPRDRGKDSVKGWERGATLNAALNGTSIAAASYIGDRPRIHIFYQDEKLNIQELVHNGGAAYVAGSFAPTIAPRFTPIAACGVFVNSGQVLAYWRDKKGQMVEYSGGDSVVGSPKRELEKASFAGIDKGPALAVVSLQTPGSLKRSLFVYRGGTNLGLYEERWVSDGKDWEDSLKVDVAS